MLVIENDHFKDIRNSNRFYHLRIEPMEAISSSIVDDVISNFSLSVSQILSNSTLEEGLIHVPICPVPSENKEIDWFLVGKGIALSMGQGMLRLELNTA